MSTAADVTYRSTPQPPAGASLVETTTFRLAQHVAAQAADQGAIAGFFGAPGTGKTHAVEHFVSSAGLDHAWITSSPRPTRKEIFEELIFEIDGTEATGSARQLRRDCLELLADTRTLVIVDEAQYLNVLWLQQLRTLHDAGRNRWPLFLVGGTSTSQTMGRHAELVSRLGYRVDFKPLSGTELHETLAAYHPVFAATSAEILDAIDRRDGFGGNLRAWATFLRNAQPLLAASTDPTKLTRKVVKAAFATMGIR